MGQSTDGQIFFGFKFDEGYEFPWTKFDEDGEIEPWWMSVNGYKPPFVMFTDEGGFAPGVTNDDPRFKEYYNHKMNWLKKNPILVQEVNYCSSGCKMIILAVDKTVMTASRGYPLDFDPNELVDIIVHRKVIVDFCEKFSIEVDGEPRWWLSSCWSN